MVQALRYENELSSFCVLNENELLTIDGGGFFSDFCTVMGFVCTAAALCNPATATAFTVLALGYEVTAFVAEKVGAP